MGTFIEFYRIDKNKVPKSVIDVMTMDVYESDGGNYDEQFFDLSIDGDDAEKLIQFPRTGNIRELFDAFMRSRGVHEGIYNTSMVTSKGFIRAFYSFALLSDILEESREKSLVNDFLKEQIDNFDFEKSFLFYTYF